MSGNGESGAVGKCDRSTPNTRVAASEAFHPTLSETDRRRFLQLWYARGDRQALSEWVACWTSFASAKTTGTEARSARRTFPDSASRSSDSSTSSPAQARASSCRCQSSKPPCFQTLRFCSVRARPPNCEEPPDERFEVVQERSFGSALFSRSHIERITCADLESLCHRLEFGRHVEVV